MQSATKISNTSEPGNGKRCTRPGTTASGWQTAHISQNANTDDRLRPDALEIMARELDNNPDIGLVYADFFITGFKNMPFNNNIRTGYSKKPDYAPEIMLAGCHIGPQPMWRASLHNEIGYFDETFTSAGDYEFWCRIALRYPLKHIPEFLGLYFHNPVGIANSNSHVTAGETRQVKQKYQGKFPTPAKALPTGYYYKKPVREGQFVNICMVTYNRLDFTQQAIDSIVTHTRFPHVITVADNNSQDGTRDYLSRLHSKGIIKNLILLNENIGIARASNLAWQMEPEAEYYLKYDNDIVIQKKNWLSDMITVVDAVPEIGVLGYNFEPKSYPLVTACGVKFRYKEIENIGGACILIPKRTKNKIGYWCEDYGLYGEEDADMGWRIRLAGLINTYMEDEDIGIHLPGGKAASITRGSWASNNIQEAELEQEYRLWKDQQRRQNFLPESRYKTNTNGYKTGKRSLFIAPQTCPDDYTISICKNSSIKSVTSESSSSKALVSIIIPVWNNLSLTRQCLDALYSNTKYHHYELIIIDNASTDETTSFLAALSGNIKIIRNPENLGFARANNQGAQAASGDYLVFLNNDTIPQTNWLTELVAFIERYPRAGIVGCKLFFADETIQHCGAAMRHDYNFFRHPYKFLERNHPLANRSKEVDAVTGACIIIPQNIFFEVGMFDETYLNGCEDMDLCTAVRQKGYSVYYNPMAELFHLTSQTPRPQNKDRENFSHYIAKWGREGMKNEIEIYEEDGFWGVHAGRYVHNYNNYARNWYGRTETDGKGKQQTSN